MKWFKLPKLMVALSCFLLATNFFPMSFRRSYAPHEPDIIRIVYNNGVSNAGKDAIVQQIHGNVKSRLEFLNEDIIQVIDRQPEDALDMLQNVPKIKSKVKVADLSYYFKAV